MNIFDRARTPIRGQGSARERDMASALLAVEQVCLTWEAAALQAAEIVGIPYEETPCPAKAIYAAPAALEQ